MANWTSPDPNSLLPGAPWTSALAQAAFENVEALSEGADTAPVIAAQWHPYNQTAVGAGTGLIWDFAADGAVAFVESPVFVDGYEYMWVWSALTVPGGLAVTLLLANRIVSTGNYDLTFSMGNLTSDGGSVQNRSYGHVRIARPFLSGNGFPIDGMVNSIPGAIANANYAASARVDGLAVRSTATTIDRSRLVPSAAVNFTGGRIWLFRRKVEGFLIL
jgi:hypothetical protein